MSDQTAMSERLIAVLENTDHAARTIARLNREGIPREAITTVSAEPFHVEPGETELPGSRIPLFAICGGVLGATIAIALTVSTSRRVDLITGGMPIVTPWAFGIIVFELTALGAILATLFRMIVEARFGRHGDLTDYDGPVSEGRVVLSLANLTSAQHGAATRILGLAPAPGPPGNDSDHE